MRSYAYPGSAIAADYVRAGLGMLACGGPVLWLDLPAFSGWLLGGLAGAFALFGVLTWRRHRSRYESEPGALVWRPPVGRRPKRYPWCDLTGLNLAYFSVRRDGEKGWMELRLQYPGTVLRIDSRLDGFAEICALALSAAEASRLSLGSATASNLRALGLEPPPGADPSHLVADERPENAADG